MERVKGIEPSSRAWEAYVLPLNHTRSVMHGRGFIRSIYKINMGFPDNREEWERPKTPALFPYVRGSSDFHYPKNGS